MAAVAHGMRGSGVPIKVAKDFLKADEAKGKFEHSRHPHSKSAWKSNKPLKRATGGPVGQSYIEYSKGGVKSYGDSSSLTTLPAGAKVVGKQSLPDKPRQSYIGDERPSTSSHQPAPHEVAQNHADKNIMRLRAALSDIPVLGTVARGIVRKNASDYIAGGGSRKAAYDPP